MRAEEIAEPATLRSADGRFALEMRLLPLHQEEHQDWHGYELHMIDQLSGRAHSLAPTDEKLLFLERAFEPEVPALCSALERAVTEGVAFTFEPIDERDFRLEVVPHGGAFLVRAQFADAPASDDLGWPAGVKVDGPSLLAFARSLTSEHQRMESARKPRAGRAPRGPVVDRVELPAGSRMLILARTEDDGCEVVLEHGGEHRSIGHDHWCVVTAWLGLAIEEGRGDVPRVGGLVLGDSEHVLRVEAGDEPRHIVVEKLDRTPVARFALSAQDRAVWTAVLTARGAPIQR